MKLLWGHKDGGPDSLVWCWGIEIKSLFSVLVLKFSPGSREAYHTHAFNAVSWLVYGELLEVLRHGPLRRYTPRLTPIFTGRTTFHKVIGDCLTPSWVVTFRGPWVDRWEEFLPVQGRERTLTHGRKEVQ